MTEVVEVARVVTRAVIVVVVLKDEVTETCGGTTVEVDVAVVTVVAVLTTGLAVWVLPGATIVTW